jgi:TatA/E family protein of Tat protein translocase
MNDFMPLAFFQNIGISEWLIILAVALLLFGSKKLPELARSLGKSVNEFKHGLADVQDQIHKSSTDQSQLPEKNESSDSLQKKE